MAATAARSEQASANASASATAPRSASSCASGSSGGAAGADSDRPAAATLAAASSLSLLAVQPSLVPFAPACARRAAALEVSGPRLRAFVVGCQSRRLSWSSITSPPLFWLCVLNTGAYHFTHVKTLVLGHFLGLDSDIYYNLCYDNKGVLDEYRRLFTFELRNINKYIFSYNDSVKQFRCDHSSLHTSIRRDINNKHASLLNHAISVKGLTPKSFQVLKNTYSQNNTVLKEMESYLSTQLANMGFCSNFQYQGGDVYCGNTLASLVGDVGFNNTFIQTQTFGDHLHGNYHGQTMTFNGFNSYNSTLSSLYNIVQTAHGTISSIHNYTYGRHHEYVSTKYNHVLPYNVIHHSTYHDGRAVPAAFQVNPFLHTPGEKVRNRYLAAASL
jgi:hypothetical protein